MQRYEESAIGKRDFSCPCLEANDLLWLTHMLLVYWMHLNTKAFAGRGRRKIQHVVSNDTNANTTSYKLLLVVTLAEPMT
jgi:hypothetical protein